MKWAEVARDNDFTSLTQSGCYEGSCLHCLFLCTRWISLLVVVLDQSRSHMRRVTEY